MQEMRRDWISHLEAAASRWMRLIALSNTFGGPSLTDPMPPCCCIMAVTSLINTDVPRIPISRNRVAAGARSASPL